MYDRLKDQLAQAAFLGDEGLRYTYYFAVSRCALQAAAITALEFCAAHADGIHRPDVCQYAKRLLQCTDGDLVATLDWAIPTIRDAGWRDCATAWFAPPQHGHSSQAAVRQIAYDLVSERNRRIGHGVLDQATAARGLDTLPVAVRHLVDGLRDLLPQERGTGGLHLESPSNDLPITSYRLIGGAPIVIRHFRRRGSTWRVRYQVLDPRDAPEGVFELAEASTLILCACEDASALRSATATVGGNEWSVSFVLPHRLTETFEGRNEELVSLREWWEDGDSRAALVYGEGGIGKTTLVLEFLHSIIESPPETLVWRPTLLVYYSAKQTRWGVDGLEQIGGVLPSVSEAVRSIVRVLEPALGREWLREDPRSLIDRASQVLADAGLPRDEILVVLDNTETLARTAAEEAELAKVLRQVATRLGRVVMTSRRLERVEARPIQVLPMDQKEGAALLLRLAVAYRARALQQAGRPRVAKVSRQLAGKPILLDVLARYVGRSGCGLDEGVRAIMSQERGDLGEFLFEDAWNRMDARHRQVFLVLGQLGDAVAGQAVGWACAEVGIPVDEWLAAFDETRFGALNDYGTQYDIAIEPGAREYLSTKYGEVPAGERAAIQALARTVSDRYQQLLRATESRVTDRVARAFRTSAAKAAKLAAHRGDFDAAVLWYEEAVKSDPGNAALLDRFAWFLMVHGELVRADKVANEACRTDPKDADAHFTAGMIAGRLARVSDADRLLEEAGRLGKEGHLCALQRARARIERLKRDRDAARQGGDPPRDRQNLITDARRLLAGAALEEPLNRREKKHMSERDRLQRQLGPLAARREERRRADGPFPKD